MCCMSLRNIQPRSLILIFTGMKQKYYQSCWILCKFTLDIFGEIKAVFITCVQFGNFMFSNTLFQNYHGICFIWASAWVKDISSLPLKIAGCKPTWSAFLPSSLPPSLSFSSSSSLLPFLISFPPSFLIFFF